jgi:hypothetical protein
MGRTRPSAGQGVEWTVPSLRLNITKRKGGFAEETEKPNNTASSKYPVGYTPGEKILLDTEKNFGYFGLQM